MGSIKQLAPEVIAAIKAGEVIDRPATVVKELVENALDAQASFITVILEDGGRKKITVTDNGHGMALDDLRLSYLPHTTSKLTSAADLYRLRSLGFRGEALASMAQVSDLTMASRSISSPSGWQIEISGGEVVAEQAIGRPVGTTITVSHLFSSVPARQKFLSSSASELRSSLRALTHLALAHPQVGWRVVHNRQVLLDISSCATLGERINQLWGESVTKQLLPVIRTTAEVGILGFIGKPQIATKGTAYQYVIVNGRPIKHPVLLQRLRNVYGTLLPPRLQPTVVLHVTLPPERLDSNIHPRKEEVLLLEEAQLLTTIEEAVHASLHQQNLTFQYHQTAASEASLVRDEQSDKQTAGVLKSTVTPWDVRSTSTEPQDVLQIANLYLIQATPDGVMLVDQHAAHERILYEQWLDNFQQAQLHPEVVALAEPVVFEVALTEVPIVVKLRMCLTYATWAK